jgi:hypothetical protein
VFIGPSIECMSRCVKEGMVGFMVGDGCFGVKRELIARVQCDRMCGRNLHCTQWEHNIRVIRQQCKAQDCTCLL